MLSELLGLLDFDQLVCLLRTSAHAQTGRGVQVLTKSFMSAICERFSCLESIFHFVCLLARID